MAEIGAIYIDPRDSYISWLKSEFAASNAIIDAFIQHLRVTNYENAEYDDVYKCVQQRRMNWGPVIHMQQYCSIRDVLTTLQNAAFRKQHDRRWDQRVHRKPGGYGKLKNAGRSIFNRSCSSGNSSFSDMNGSVMDIVSESSCNQKGEKNSVNCDVQNGEITHETQFAKLDKSCVTETDCNLKDEKMFITDCTKLNGSRTLQEKEPNTAFTSNSSCIMVGGEALLKRNLQNGETLHEAEFSNLDTCVTITDCNKKEDEKLFGSDCTKLDSNHALQTKGSNADSISESSCNLKGRENLHNCNLKYGKILPEADLSKLDSVDVTEIDYNMKDKEKLFGTDCTKLDDIHALQSKGPNTACTSDSSCSMESGETLLKCNLQLGENLHAMLDTCVTATDCNMKDYGDLFIADCTGLDCSHALQTKGTENLHKCHLKNGKISHEADLAKLDTVDVIEIDCNMNDKNNLFKAGCTKLDGIHALHNKGSNTTTVPENYYSLKGGENSHNCNQTNGEISHEDDLANHDAVCVTEIDRNMKDREILSGGDCTEIDRIHALQNKGNSDNILHTILSQIKINEKNQSEDGELVAIPRVFVAYEMRDGKQVNVVDGLKQYVELFGTSDVKKIISLSRDLRASGRKGLLKGRTFLSLERPMKGHGREMIQLGSIVAGHLEAKNMSGSLRECRVELIPTLVEDIFDRLLQLKILTVKPDFCIIDFFSEGEYAHPNVWPTWYGRPVCNLFLTECDMALSTSSDMHRAHQGSLKFTFAPGDVIVMEGKSADMVRRSIPPCPNQRVLLTFGKSQPKKQSSTPGPHSPPMLNHRARPYPPPQPPMLPAMPLAMPYPAQPWAPVSGTGVFFPSPEKDVEKA